MTAAPPKTPASKKLTPQQRAIEKKQAIWRKFRAVGGGGSNAFDPDTYDWEKHGPHFDKLSDGEWADVWRHVLAASHRNPSGNEARVRELVDDAAISSGWFAEYGELHISRADYRRFATEDRRFLKKVQQFRREIAEFLGDPPDDHKEPYDPWEEYRRIVPLLDRLAARLNRKIFEAEDDASIARDSPSAAKPELDIWRARLVMAWRDECHLAVRNTKPLRGFLLDALRPYTRAETDRMAKHFIKKWLEGEVKNPGASRLQIFTDK